MTLNGWTQIALYCVIIIAITKPFGGYLTRVFNGERTALSPALGWLERGIYRLSGIDPKEEQHWLTYAFATLAFSGAGFVALYAIQRLRAYCPSIRRSFRQSAPTSRSTRRSASYRTPTGSPTYPKRR